MKEQNASHSKTLAAISSEIIWRCRAKSLMQCVGGIIFVSYPILMGLYIIYTYFEKYGTMIRHIPILRDALHLMNLMLANFKMPDIVIAAVVGTVCLPLLVSALIFTVMRLRRKSFEDDAAAYTNKVSEKNHTQMLMSMCEGMKKFNGNAGITLSAVFFFVLIWIGISLMRYGAVHPESANFMSGAPFVITCLAAYLLIICPILVFISDMMAGVMFLMYRCPADIEEKLQELCENFSEESETYCVVESRTKSNLPQMKTELKKES